MKELRKREVNFSTRGNTTNVQSRKSIMREGEQGIKERRRRDARYRRGKLRGGGRGERASNKEGHLLSEMAEMGRAGPKIRSKVDSRQSIRRGSGLDRNELRIGYESRGGIR